MAKHYSEPTLEIIELRLTDVILTSDYTPSEWELPIFKINAGTDLGIEELPEE